MLGSAVYSVSRSSALFLLVLMLGFILGASFAPERVVYSGQAGNYAAVDGERTVEMGVPAVDVEGNGVVAKLKTTIRPGTGQVLVNVNDVLAQFDTQLSGRSAAKAVSSVTGKNLGSLDIIYDIEVNATAIEGPSAGASMAASVYLALEGMQAPDYIMMSGTVSDDGVIGPVGELRKKIEAAKNGGASLFIVPENQSTEESSIRSRDCRQTGRMEVCTIRYKYTEIGIGAAFNITVVEAGTLDNVIGVYGKELRPESS